VVERGGTGRSGTPPGSKSRGETWQQLTPARFFGGYEHSIDAKGRLILPAKFRPAFERGGYISEHHGGCLALWTPEEFERQLGLWEQESEAGAGSRNLMRLRAQASEEVEMDRQGRMVLPARLRRFAELEDSVWVNGAVNRVELWNPERWRPIQEQMERQLREDF
jgi:MraZ protein